LSETIVLLSSHATTCYSRHIKLTSETESFCVYLLKCGATAAFRHRHTELPLLTGAVPHHRQAARRQTTFTLGVKVATFDPAKVAESFRQLAIQLFLCAFKTYVFTFDGKNVL